MQGSETDNRQTQADYSQRHKARNLFYFKRPTHTLENFCKPQPSGPVIRIMTVVAQNIRRAKRLKAPHDPHTR